MTSPEGLAQHNGLIVFHNTRHDWAILPREAPYCHVTCFIRDVHTPSRKLWLHYPARRGLWMPRVLDEAVDCKDPNNGECYGLADAIRAALIDLDLDGDKDASAIVIPWTFPAHRPWRPYYAWRRTSTGQVKWLAGIHDWRIRRPLDLHEWLTNPDKRDLPWWLTVRGVLWITWMTVYRLTRWALRSGKAA